MKARLAKKIAHMPINRLSPRWLDRFSRWRREDLRGGQEMEKKRTGRKTER